MSESRSICLYITTDQLAKVDEIAKLRATGGLPPSRSAVVRDLLDDALKAKAQAKDAA